MKITIVQGAFLPVPPLLGGAVEKCWFALGQEFARRGHEVTHVSRAFSDLPKQEVIDGVQHIRTSGFETPKSLVLLKALDLVYSLRVLPVLPRADILVTNTFWLPMLCRSPKHGLLYIHVARFPKRQMRFYRHAARLQAVSSAVLDAILEQTPDVAAKVAVVGLPLSKKCLVERTPKTNLNNRLLYTGRLHPEKGLELLIKAFSSLLKSGLRNWKLRIIGPWEVSQGGGGREYLLRLKQLSSQCAGLVEILEPEFDEAILRKHYEEADLFIYPSLAELGESFGLAPLEAMAAYCPSLVSDLGCFRDFIRDGENGFVFNHRATDPMNELAKKMGALLEKPEMLLQIGKKARTTAEQFSVENLATDYLNDFARVIQNEKHNG